MVLKNEDEITREIFPPFGIINDKAGIYKNFKTPDMEEDAIYIIKAGAELNTEAHTNVLSQISSGKVNFLIDQKEAKVKYLSSKAGSDSTVLQRAEYLKPFNLTSILREEMLNLKQNKQGNNVVLSPVNSNIGHDKFSAFEYGLYYIKKTEDDIKAKHKGDLKDYIFYTKG